MLDRYTIKALLTMPKDTSKCQLCHKKECSDSVLIWSTTDSYDVDGLYVCEDCKRMYLLVGYNCHNTMNWATYLMRCKSGK